MYVNVDVFRILTLPHRLDGESDEGCDSLWASAALREAPPCLLVDNPNVEN